MKTIVVLTLLLLSAVSASAHKEKQYQAAEYYGDQVEKDGLVCNGGGQIDRDGDISVREYCRDNLRTLHGVMVGNTVYYIEGRYGLVGTLKGTPLSVRFGEGKSDRSQRTMFVVCQVCQYNKEERFHIVFAIHVKN
jgi:hypothetical protein